MSAPRVEDLLADVDPSGVAELRAGENHDPHRILGLHPARIGRRPGHVVRSFHPDAVRVEFLAEGRRGEDLTSLGDGLFAGFLAGAKPASDYRLRFHFSSGGSWERGDPYAFLPTLGDFDLHLLGEGTHRRLWSVLGAQPRSIEGVSGTRFAVWAPNARRVSVVGDFCAWDGRLFPMRSLGSSGVFELFIPDVGPDALYKYEVRTQEGALRLKADPLGAAMEAAPANASRVVASQWKWADSDWMSKREGRDWRREPLSIYEVHLGSWARVPEEEDRPLRYREIAPRLVDHVRRLGFTHVELLPVAEHPFYGSWGYQVTGYYAPTARYGSPDDLRFLVETLHEADIGVILDWVPAHFPKDDYALRRFDGTALYEHEDPRRGEHPDWGTLIFNYDRAEVRNFLSANALYWLQEFHFDALRVDAVASMLYLDYSRQPGEWLPNPQGGRENLGAIELLRATNAIVAEEVPGAFTVAEESTAWPGVTRGVAEGGLGFTFKWNMGWMHDTLRYLERDPIYRGHHHHELAFAMSYEHSECFVNPLSHDEVVHGKRSLLEKMPGDRWQKFANLRLLLAYQFTRPGKQLLFMGTELAPSKEWSHDHSLDWHLASEPDRQGFASFLAALSSLYRRHPALWRRDPDPEGFAWADASDRAQSVISYLRSDGEELLLVVLNLTPVPREKYRVGVPRAGSWTLHLTSDAKEFGGSGLTGALQVETQEQGWHGQPQSLCLDLPPLGALVLGMAAHGQAKPS